MRFTQVLIAAVLMSVSSLAMAETVIGILNVQGVVLSSNMANDFRSQLERDLKPLADSLQSQADALKKMQEDGQKNGDFLSDEQKRQMAADYSQKVREFQKSQEEMSREQATREQAFVESVRPKIDAVVNQIVSSRNIDLLLDRRSVLFAKPGTNLDISKDVLDALNASQ